MRVLCSIAVLVCLSTSLLATDVQITEKSGKVYVVKDVGVTPSDLRWHEGDTMAIVSFWNDIQAFKVTAARKTGPNAFTYTLAITLRSGRELTKHVNGLLLSWRSADGISYQLNIDKIYSVSAIKP
jgi:hypothetical protein